jgi:uncharacterized iron-regulated membrane protein
MKVLRVSTQVHKWITLVVGIQVLFWVVGGLVMTAIPISTVRSEHHVAEIAPAPLPLGSVLSVAEAARRAGLVPTEAVLKSGPRGPTWVFKIGKGDPVAVSAVTGRRFAPLTARDARAVAQAAYKGGGRAVSATLLPLAPEETGKSGPLWRVDFDDAEKTTFYLAPDTAEVVSKRSDVWRFYDFFWRLHIMNLENGSNFNHPLIVVTTILTLSMVISGIIMLWLKLGRDLRTWLATRAAKAP